MKMMALIGGTLMALHIGAENAGRVKVGDPAPDFTLPNQSGTMVSLRDFVGKKNVVVYFYPKDFTPGCTKESCTFRDRYEGFTKMGAAVVGISSDSVESHGKFASKYHLPFDILSDDGGKVRALYGVPSSIGFPGRVTYIVDKQGVVRHIFSSQFRPKKHINEALRVLKTLQ